MSFVREHDDEPVRGLPEALPDGETVLWQGAPDARSLALRAFHLRALAVYFAILLAWRGLDALASGASAGQALGAVLWAVPLAGAALALVATLAWLSARTTMYTLTNRRVVMRIGVVLTVTFNLPLRVIASVDLRTFPDGSGDVSIALAPGNRIAWLQLWPHVRPWRVAPAQPTLRSVPGARALAERIGAVLRDAAPSAAAHADAAPSAGTPRAHAAPA